MRATAVSIKSRPRIRSGREFFPPAGIASCEPRPRGCDKAEQTNHRAQDRRSPAENEPKGSINERQLSVCSRRHFDNRKQAAVRINAQFLIPEPCFVTTKVRSRKRQK